MLFKGIGQAVEQRVSLTTVVRLLLTEIRQPASASKPVQPASSPGPVLEDSMQIGSCGGRTDPAQALIFTECVAVVDGFAASPMQFEPLDPQLRLLIRPKHKSLPLMQRLFAAEHRSQGEQAKAGDVAAGLFWWPFAFQSIRIVQFLPEHLHAATDAEELTAVFGITDQFSVQSAAAQGSKIAKGLFTSRDHDGIG